MICINTLSPSIDAGMYDHVLGNRAYVYTYMWLTTETFAKSVDNNKETVALYRTCIA